MSRRAMSLALAVALLLLAVALAARGARPVGAETLPAIATPRTAHLRLDGSFKADGPAAQGPVELRLAGQGDYDAPGRALQFSAELVTTVTPAGLPQTERRPFALVIVDGRIYWRDPATNRWTW